VFHVWTSLPYQNAIWHGFVVAAAACHYLAVLREIAAA
jgi:hemolysin III